MTIEVTRDDITAALNAPDREDITECCPIAQALKRMFPGQDVHVSIYGLKVGGTWYLATVPDPVFEVISLSRYFWTRVRPFSFEAEALCVVSYGYRKAELT